MTGGEFRVRVLVGIAGLTLTEIIVLSVVILAGGGGVEGLFGTLYRRLSSSTTTRHRQMHANSNPPFRPDSGRVAAASDAAFQSGMEESLNK